MKNLFYLLIIVVFIISCNQTQNKQVQAPKPKDGVFIHIKEGYKNPHKVLMPMKMATLMADDKAVLIYMDIDAVNLLVKGAKDLTYKGFESFQTYMNQLLAKNVGIYACPGCLNVADIKKDQLWDGIQIAQKDKFFNFTKGRIITLDY